jgi:type VI protein secretion system component VasF
MPRPWVATVVMPRGRARRCQRRLELQRLVAGVNPLLKAARPCSRCASSCAHQRTTTGGLRRQLLAQIASSRPLPAPGVPRPKVTAARYPLCSFIDEVSLNVGADSSGQPARSFTRSAGAKGLSCWSVWAGRGP